MRHSKYSMVNWFIRQAMENNTIKVYGNGEQLRDYIYVDDLADAFIAAAYNPKCHGEIYNIGSGIGTSFIDMVKTIVTAIGSGSFENVPWPPGYINVETGNYVTNIEKISKTLNWKPKADLATGIRMTHAFYQKYRQYYW